MSLAVRDRVALVTGGTDGIGMKRLVPLLIDPWLAQTPTEAAAAGLRLLLGDEFEGVTGALFLKIRKFRALDPSARTRDRLTGRRLWALSERLAAAYPGEGVTGSPTRICADK
jgi:hypothetical protein